MNNYSSWWNSTITLYNKFVDGDNGEIKWFRTVIEGCFYSHSTEKITVGETTLSSNVSICRIRVNDDFVNPSVWKAFDDEHREQHFTLKAGDIIVAGEVDFEIDEYTKGHRSADLINQYKDWPGVFTAETVHIDVGGGRGNEHYLAKGV